MTRRSTLKFWVLVPALALVLAGCGEDSGDGGAAGGPELVSEGKLINCTGLPYKPFEYEENGDVIGFDVDLVDLVAKKLGVEQEIVDTPFDGIQSGADFNSGKCDISAAGMTINDERKQNIDFSDPYFDATQALVAKKGSGTSRTPTSPARSSAPRTRPPATTTPTRTPRTRTSSTSRTSACC